MWDSLVRATAYDNKIRVSAAVTTRLVEEARNRHQTWPVATAALGRVMTGALLLSWGLKDTGSITVRVLGDGPLGGIIADVNYKGEVRGYVQNPQIDLPLNDKGKLDVGKAVGKGNIYVTKDIGLKEPYTGSVPLVSGEIGEDMASFLYHSEQTPSLVALGVLVNPDLKVAASGGLIIQALPDAPKEILIKIEENLKNLQSISTLVKESKGPKEIIDAFLPETEIKVLAENPIAFRCKCNRERIESILLSLGSKELSDILEKEGKSQVRCHFCNETYNFSKEDLEELLTKVKTSTACD